MTCPHSRPRRSTRKARKLEAESSYSTVGDNVELLKEVEKSRFDDVCDLITHTFSDEVISAGIGALKYPDDPAAASDFSVEIPDILEGVLADLGAIPSNFGGRTRSSCFGGCETSEFLNRLADAIRKTYDIPIDGGASREFSCRFGYGTSTKPDMDGDRKPDVVVMNLRKSRLAEFAKWSNVHAVLALKETNTVRDRESVFKQLVAYARRVFYSQTTNRRFVLGVAFLGSYVSLYYFNRSGVFSSDSFSIKDDPGTLVRVIAGLMFADATDLGYDPSIVQKNNNAYALVHGDEYLLKKIIFSENGIVGKGTNCFLAERRGQEYVIKDSWIESDSGELEDEILRRVRGVEGVIQMIDHELVTIRGRHDTTQASPKAQFSRTDHHVILRDHHRIVHTPYGKPLKCFSSLIELVSAIKDIIKAIKDLAERDIVHCDISSHNVILPSSSSSPLRRGHLIDFDNAIHREGNARYITPRGTLPFMALDVLKAISESKRLRQEYYHDLESVFYLLCYTCIVQVGPNNSPSDPDFVVESEIKYWSKSSQHWCTWELVRMRKELVMHDPEEFEFCVLNDFALYFKDIKQCIRALRTALFPQKLPEKLIATKREHIDQCRIALKDPGPRHVNWLRDLLDLDELDLGDSNPIHQQDRDEVFGMLFKILDDTLAELRAKEGKRVDNTVTDVKRKRNSDSDSEDGSSSASPSKRKRVQT